MSAFYNMQERPDMRQEGIRSSYPRLTGGRVVSTDELAGRMCRNSTFSASEVKGMLDALAEQMAEEMRNGNRVKIEGLGTFGASLGLAEGVEPEVPGEGAKRNALSIRIRGVNYRADKDFIVELNRGLHLVRASRKGGRSSSRYSPEERLALAVAYLDGHPFLTVLDYCRLTGLCVTPAREELRRWADTEGSGIGRTGTGSHRVYVRA